MADVMTLAPFILSWEGGFVNDKADTPTNKGVTIATWRKQGYDKDGDGDIDVDDLKLISDEDAVNVILHPHYWNRWKADQIHSQSLANILVDWVWGSGAHGIKIPQQMLGVKVDGIVGPKTIEALNNTDYEEFFNQIKQRRFEFFKRVVVANPVKKKFLDGWNRRLSYIGWGTLKCNNGKVIRFTNK